MTYAMKTDLLTGLCAPFGLSWLSVQDMLIPDAETRQKDAAYGEFYDRAVLSLNFVPDLEPVHFNYMGKTWLIVFCKGQFGINTGAWVGIYHADTIIPPALRQQTAFQAVSKEEALPVKIRLIGPDCPLFSVEQKQWRIGGFITGVCTSPDDLLLEVSITFPNTEMCNAFFRSMQRLGYQESKLLVYQTTVQFYYTSPKADPLIPPDDFFRNFTLHKNRFFCRLFLWMTAPCFTALDRLIYLHYTCPFLFRRTLASLKPVQNRRWGL